MTQAKKAHELQEKQAKKYKFKLDKLVLVVKSREDKFTQIIKSLVSSGANLKANCELLFSNTKSIYQNLTLMIEDDFSQLEKAMKKSFSCKEDLN